MSNPWAQLVDVYGQGLDRQLAMEKSRMDTEANMPEYFMKGFFEAQKNRMAQQQAQADMDLKKAHAQYYRNSEGRDAETYRKNSIKERNDLLNTYRKTLDAYSRRAPGDSNNVNLENELRDLEKQMDSAGMDYGQKFVTPHGKKLPGAPGVAADADNPDLSTWLNQPKPHIGDLGNLLSGEVPQKTGDTGGIPMPEQPKGPVLPMFPTKPDEPDQFEPFKGTDVRNQEGKLANSEQRTKNLAEEALQKHEDRVKRIETSKDINTARLASRDADRSLRRDIASVSAGLRSGGLAVSQAHLALAQKALDWKIQNSPNPKMRAVLTAFKTKINDPLFRMSATPDTMADVFNQIEDAFYADDDSAPDSTPTPAPIAKPKPSAPKSSGSKPAGKLTPVN